LENLDDASNVQKGTEPEGIGDPTIARSNTSDSETDDDAVGQQSQGKMTEPKVAASAEPSNNSRQLFTTERTINIFTVVASLSAGVSATVAIWTALQLAASGAQTDAAIRQMETLAAQTKRQADLAADAIGDNQSIANESNRRTDRALVLSKESADAATIATRAFVSITDLKVRILTEGTTIFYKLVGTPLILEILLAS
jgi:hypothetical protein